MQQEMTQIEKQQYLNNIMQKYVVPPNAIFSHIPKIFKEAVKKFLYTPLDTMFVSIRTQKLQVIEDNQIELKINRVESNSFLVGRKSQLSFSNQTFNLAHSNLIDNTQDDIVLQYLIREPQKDFKEYKLSSVNEQNLALSEYFIKNVSKIFEVYAFVQHNPQNQPSEINQTIPYKCIIKNDIFAFYKPFEQMSFYKVMEIWPITQNNNINIERPEQLQQVKTKLQIFCESNQKMNPCILLEVSLNNIATNWIVQYSAEQSYNCYQEKDGKWVPEDYGKFSHNCLKYRGGMWILEEVNDNGQDILYKLDKLKFYEIQNDEEFIITNDNDINYQQTVRAYFHELIQGEAQQQQQEQL